MAVYTPLDHAALSSLVARFDVGALISAEGIADGVSNSNWLVVTDGRSQSDAATGARFVLTMFERRISPDDLPFFLTLLDHLATHGCPVPRTIPARDGKPFIEFTGKAVALIEFLPGTPVREPTPALAHAAGKSLAGVHLASASFPLQREQALGLAAWRAMLEQAGTEELASFEPALPAFLARELDELERGWPTGLPPGAIHADLFPDNVLAVGEDVTGLIDFYFAANDAFAYDLAVTHAAWCFNDDGARFHADRSAALLAGYASVRALAAEEHQALPLLARGAAMRFVASRAVDWFQTPPDAVVQRKDPMAFVRRLRFYRENGASVFTTSANDATRPA